MQFAQAFGFKTCRLPARNCRHFRTDFCGYVNAQFEHSVGEADPNIAYCSVLGTGLNTSSRPRKKRQRALVPIMGNTQCARC